MYRIAVVALFAVGTLHGTGKIGPRLDALISSPGHGNTVLVWVFFTDKGTHEALSKSVPADVVSPRSLARRMKVRSAENVVDYTDLPIEEDYARTLISLGFTLRQYSKWFNAASGIVDVSLLDRINALPFVREVELVARFARDQSEGLPQDHPSSSRAEPKVSGTHSLDYGASLGQLDLMNVPSLHDQHITGKGVIIGVFDNGFRLLAHEAFDSITIVGMYDFVDHKVSVMPNNPSTAFGSHGIQTLSEIAGRKDGQLIGAAFDASFILARTENDSSEKPIEEDNWVAAIEWADSLGVDVTSTSLGYLTYDAPYSSFSWLDMDGSTMLITRSADMAVSKGILVINSAGNGGANAGHNTLNAPADGHTVIAIGAVNPDRTRASFSSVGPTTDFPARIKPDLMAQGTNVRVVSSVNTTGYSDFFAGTSAACPLAAGAAALLIQVDPSASPIEIANALRASAGNTSSPDNAMGWGIINATAAASLLSLIDVPGSSAPTTFSLRQNYPNPFNPSTNIRFDLPSRQHVRLTVYDVLGRTVATLLDDFNDAGSYIIPWRPDEASSGVYFYRLTTERYSDTRKMIYQK